MTRTSRETVDAIIQRALRKHAFDGEGRDLDGAYRCLYKALDHLYDARDGEIEFDEDIFTEHVKNATDCLKAGAADELSETERDQKSAEARDSAMGYDINALFQIDELDPRYNRPITRRAKPQRRPARQPPSHAHDTLASTGYDVDSLFQRNR